MQEPSRFIAITLIGILIFLGFIYVLPNINTSKINQLLVSDDSQRPSSLIIDVAIMAPGNEPKKKIVIGAVICGRKEYMEDGLALMKSAILSSEYHNISTNSTLHAVILAEKKYMETFNRELGRFQGLTKTLKFSYEVHPIVVDAMQQEWNTRFNLRCATQRLILHNALPHISEILYLDADTLVVGDLRQVWSKFEDMNEKQVMGMVREEEESQVGRGYNFYRKRATFPFYPPLGLNSGVLLMNLTRLRKKSDLDWDGAILKAYEKYGDQMFFADQCMINVVFSERPDAVFLLPCAYNYRADHCAYGNSCKSAENSNGSGAVIVHGNSRVFHLNLGQPAATRQLTALHKYFLEFDMDKGDYIRDVVHPFKKKMAEMEGETCSILANSGEGTGLLFIAFAEAANNMAWPPPFWSVIFFFALYTVGINSTFGTIEGAVMAIVDMGIVKWPRWVLTTLVCGSLMALSMVFPNGWGYYILDYFDTYTANWSLLIVALMEVSSVSWVYGLVRFSYDLKLMTGKIPGKLMLICLRFISPATLIIVLVSSIYKEISAGTNGFLYDRYSHDAGDINGSPYKDYVVAIGFILLFVCIVFIPLEAVLSWRRLSLFRRKKGVQTLDFPEEELRQEKGLLSKGDIDNLFDKYEKKIIEECYVNKLYEHLDLSKNDHDCKRSQY